MSDETTTSTAVERHVEADQPLSPALVNSRELRSLQAMANAYSMMPGLAKHYAGKPEAVMAALLTAHSLDLPVNPVVINQFYDVQGRLYPSTQIVIALAARAGVRVWFDAKSDETKATAYCQRAGSGAPPDAYTYTIEMARKAGLTNKDVWKQHPEIMLRYRASSRLLRTVAADVVLGIPSGVLDGDAGIDPVTRQDIEAKARHIEIPDDDEVAVGEVVCPVKGCAVEGDHTHDPHVSKQAAEYDADDETRPY